jgi:DNA-binding beta-propeller fold protein YncE
LTADGTHVWVANEGNNTVTELSESDGSLVRTLSSPTYGFRGPTGIASDGTGVWVANGGGSSVTELAETTGNLIRTVQVAPSGRTFLLSITSVGTHVWVTNGLANSVTELSASSGAVLRSIKGANEGIAAPTDILADGTDVWVGSGNNVTDLGESTGHLRRVITIGRSPSAWVDGIVRIGPYVWVLAGSSGLVEIEASTGRVLRRIPALAKWVSLAGVLTANQGRLWIGSQWKHSVAVLNGTTGQPITVFDGSRYGFSPRAITSDGLHVWVANHNSVAEFDGSSFRLMRLIRSTQIGDADASELAANASTVFVTGQDTGIITEISVARGIVVKRIEHWGTPNVGPTAISADSSHLWLTTYQDSVVELDAATGGAVATLNAAPYAFDGPDAIALRAGQAWVANYADDSVTEFSVH